MSTRGGYNIDDQYDTYFVTFTVVGWVDIFSRLECRDIIIDSLKYCSEQKGLSVHAYVIMTNHIHLLVTAQEDSNGLSAIIRDFKRHTAKQLIQWITESKNESRREWMDILFKHHGKNNLRNKNYQIWIQDNHPMHCIHPRFTNQKINYIHNNPVKAGIVRNAQDYYYSSAGNYAGEADVLLNVDMIDF